MPRYYFEFWDKTEDGESEYFVKTCGDTVGIAISTTNGYRLMRLGMRVGTFRTRKAMFDKLDEIGV